MPAPAQVLFYSLFILLASLAGGWISLVGRLTHTRTQLLMSFVAGLMLGVGLFHMLPHAAYETGSLDRTVWWAMIGLLMMFFLQRFFHFHQHGPTEMGLHEDDPYADAREHAACDHDHDHDRARIQSAIGHHHHASSHGHALNWVGMTAGLTIHTLLDGIALAASVEAEATAPAAVGLFGLGTFLAIVLHKPLDAMAITALMVAGGWPPLARHLVNGLFALVVPLGAGLFYLGVRQVSADEHAVVGCALAFSAGTFLCISLSDLLPEVQFHTHDRIKLSLALLAGIAASYAIGFLESAGHNHLHLPVRQQAGSMGENH
jgi:zinc and cadmium transporter